MPPPMFPPGLYWPAPYPMPYPPSDPRPSDGGQSQDPCPDLPRKSTHKTKHLPPPSSPSGSERSVPSSDSEEDNEDDKEDRGTSTPDSNVAKSSPPASSDAIPNYPEFVKRMANMLNIPIHHPDPQYLDHLFDQISSDRHRQPT
ncbi:hypothetical protein JRQ81_010697 [Phrynocephalus forsythii]|uniref:Uncharacterized protein n=1 Tax=Phrynocephalus forsythii TaxID=171643 RepID=A0A9Q0Y114_9SAUR|nr:hypothetical protein JRQ81_010697 [Phrynocephalus forsythii]